MKQDTHENETDTRELGVVSRDTHGGGSQSLDTQGLQRPMGLSDDD